MLRKTIHVVVKDDGTVKTDFSNFTGTDCLAAGQQIHALLTLFGVQVNEATMTPKPELLAAQGVEQETMADLELAQTMQMEE